MIQLLYDASLKTQVLDKSFDILFQRTPTSILGTDKIEGIELAVNQLQGEHILFAYFDLISWQIIIKLTGEKAIVTDEKYLLKCDLAFRSIGYRSIQADPDIPFDKASSTVPQNNGRLKNCIT